MEALRLEGVTAGYGAHPVLEDVDMEIDYGEVVALLGPNGAGKTTLLRLVLGLLKPWKGRILLEGKDLSSLSHRTRARKISWVPQETTRLQYTVLEYVLMGRTPYLGYLSLPCKEDYRAAEAALEAVGLRGYMDKPVESLSGGERQLAMIARALAQEARIMLLDEPTSHLDLGNKARVLRIIKNLGASGYAVLFTTHDPNEALLVADKAVLLSNGRVAASGPPEQVVRPEKLSGIYGVELEELKWDNKSLIVPRV